MTLTRSLAFLLSAAVATIAAMGVELSLGNGLSLDPGILLFVGLPTFAPLAILAARPVGQPGPWVAILIVLAGTWGWVMIEYSRPYQGGGVNFAALSGAGISILVCIPAIVFAALASRKQNEV